MSGSGSVWLRAAAATVLAGSASAAPVLPVGSGEWEAAVIDVSSPSGAEQRAFVRLDAGGGSEDGRSARLRLAATLPGADPRRRISVRGTVAAAPTDAPGFADFLESRGAAGTLKAHALSLTAAGGGFTASVEQLRWGIDAALSQAIPEPEAGLAAGILIGLRERVVAAVADDFTTTGLTHVVAISGWNIALVAGIATALLRATGLARRPRSAVVIAAIVAYTILAGAEASVMRAAVMGGVVLIAREGGRPSGAAAALGVACWGLLLFEPTMIDDIGLQLSLAATAGLLALGRPRGVGRATRHARSRTALVSETFGVSLAAQLATLPLILLHFGRLSLISPLANLAGGAGRARGHAGRLVGVLLGPIVGFASFMGPLLHRCCWGMAATDR